MRRLRCCLAALVSLWTPWLLLAQRSETDLAKQYELARQALERYDYPTAAAAWRAIVDIEPNLPEARSNLGLMYHQQREFERAIEQFHEALRLNADLAAARLFLGIDYYLTSRPSKAIEQLTRAVVLNPDSALAHKWLAMSHLQVGHFAEAVSELGECRRLDPKDSELVFYLGRAYLKLAERTFESLRRQAPNSPWFFLLRGEQFVKQHKPAEAVVEFEHAKRIDPHLPGVHYQLAMAHLALGNLPEAMGAYQRELLRFPVHARTASGFVHLLNRLGLNAEAEELATSAGRFRQGMASIFRYSDDTVDLARVRTSPAASDRKQLRAFLQEYRAETESYVWNSGPWQRQARDLLLAGNPVAVLELTARVSSEESSAEADYWKARAYLELGRWDDALSGFMDLADSPLTHPAWRYYLQNCAEKLALQTLGRFSRLEPNSPRTYQLQAEFSAAQGNTQEAIEGYKKALQAKPGAPELHLAIGDLYFVQRQYEEALTAYRAELKNDTYSVAALTKAGDVCRLTGRPEEAQQFLSRALGIDAASDSAHRVLGNLYFDQGHFAEAVEHLEAALKNGDPNDETVHYRLGRAFHVLGNRPKANEHLAVVRGLQQKRRVITQGRIEAAAKEKQDSRKRPSPVDP